MNKDKVRLVIVYWIYRMNIDNWGIYKDRDWMYKYVYIN
jgi:hypothetical protein